MPSGRIFRFISFNRGENADEVCTHGPKKLMIGRIFVKVIFGSSGSLDTAFFDLFFLWQSSQSRGSKPNSTTHASTRATHRSHTANRSRKIHKKMHALAASATQPRSRFRTRSRSRSRSRCCSHSRSPCCYCRARPRIIS